MKTQKTVILTTQQITWEEEHENEAVPKNDKMPIFLDSKIKAQVHHYLLECMYN